MLILHLYHDLALPVKSIKRDVFSSSMGPVAVRWSDSWLPGWKARLLRICRTSIFSDIGFEVINMISRSNHALILLETGCHVES